MREPARADSRRGGRPEPAHERPGDDDGGDEVERGSALLRQARQVMPEDASPRIRALYDDVKATLRVPVVNTLFRVLAGFPEYFEDVWGRLRPVVGSRPFEAAADMLRAQAVLRPLASSQDEGWIQFGQDPELRGFLDTIHYVLPKLLLVATALDLDARAAPAAAPGATRRLADLDPLPRGPAPEAQAVTLVDPERARDEVRDVFRRILRRHRHPTVASFYRGLALRPDLLSAVWERVEPVVGSSAYDQRRELLISDASSLLGRIPWPAPDGGADRPGGRAPEQLVPLLAAFRMRLIPDLLLDVGMVKNLLEGPQAARVSRLSVAQREASRHG